MRCAYKKAAGFEDDETKNTLKSYYEARLGHLEKLKFKPAPGNIDPTQAPVVFTPNTVAVGDKKPLPVKIDYQSFLKSGWFGVGKKKDVPKCACYVGHHCDTYVWVTRDHMDSLTRFTLAIMDISVPYVLDPLLRQQPFGFGPSPPNLFGTTPNLRD